MIRNLTRPNLARYLYLFGIFLLAASLPFSKFLISLSQLILLFSWLLDGRILEKLKAFSRNRTALLVSSVFLLHLLGLLYTSDFDYGLEDVKKKIPLLLLPLILSTSAPLSKDIFEKLLSVFVAAVITASLVCLFVLLGFTSRQIVQPQEASIFMSHIRFGIMIGVAVFILGYFFIEKSSVLLKVLLSSSIAWLIAFLIMMESATGLGCIAVTTAVLLLALILKARKPVFKLAFAILFLLGCAAAVKTFLEVSGEFEHSQSDKKNISLLTKKGNPYLNDTTRTEIENGSYVWLSVCEGELFQEWSKRSKIDFYGRDLKGNDVQFTLIRFLTSKGLKKDAEGVNALSDEEVKAIEKGVANVNFMGVFNPTARLQKVIWEFKLYLGGGNPSGHSVVQRFEFWKAATEIIRENPLFGVGTGDVEASFNHQYEKMNSALSKEWRLRSHNQFLAIGTAFGLLGLGWFLISLFYPLASERRYTDYLYLTFFIILFLSMFTEDTLESQAGVTLFAFFNSLLLFAQKEKSTP